MSTKEGMRMSYIMNLVMNATIIAVLVLILLISAAPRAATISCLSA